MSDLEQSTGVRNPLVLLQAMIEKGVQPEQLSRLMDLAERWEANRAAEAFAEAVTGFQAECPMILKRRKAGTRENSKVKFDFASYDDVMKEAGPLLAKWKIVPSFTTEPAEQGVKCTCRIRVGTHVELTTLTLPIPAGVVNDTQLYGQAVTYAKRYALCAALNIVVSDEDNDASKCLDTIDQDDVRQLNTLIEEKGVNLDAFLRYALR